MTAPDVNVVQFMIGDEETVGVLPATSTGHILEPNSVSKWGADITSERRQPISADRMPRGSTVTDLDSGAEMALDLTCEHLRVFLSQIMMASDVGRECGVMYPTSVTADEYVVADINVTIPVGRLIWADGFALAANNGLKVIAGVPSDVHVPADNIAVEAVSADQKATIEICGVQGATADFRINASGNLTTENAGLDMTTLGWQAGQILHLGDPASGSAYRFATITDDQYDNGDGFVRIESIAAHVVTLKQNTVIVANGADVGAAKTIRVLYGAFFREYADDHANHAKTYATIEATFPELDAGTDAYSYGRGNLLSTATLEFPLTALCKMTLKWVGTDTPIPTTSREGWDHKLPPVLTQPFNTTTSWRRRRLCTKDTGTAVVTGLKNLTLTIGNNIMPEKVQGQLGALKLNVGNRTAEGASTWLFDDPDIWAAIRTHDKLDAALAMGGEDGGFYIDLPTVRMSGGNPGLELNTSVTTEVTIMPEKDTVLGFMIGFNRFPYLP